jgi:hypothetical protein
MGIGISVNRDTDAHGCFDPELGRDCGQHVSDGLGAMLDAPSVEPDHVGDVAAGLGLSVDVERAIVSRRESDAGEPADRDRLISSPRPPL